MAGLSCLELIMRLVMILMWGVTIGQCQSQTETTINGVRFGEMKTLVSTRNNVYDIQPDILEVSHLLFSDQYGIHAFNGSGVYSLIGGTTNGYAEGAGYKAKFNHISSFLQWNASTIFLPDNGNSCIRRVKRRGTWLSSLFLGTCGSRGFRDGENPAFNEPYCLIQDIRSPDTLLLTDYRNAAIRMINIKTKVTTTIIQDQVKWPKGIRFDVSNKFLLISSRNALSKFDPDSGTVTRLAGGGMYGYSDGTLSMAEFYNPENLMIVSTNITIVADHSGVVRVVNFSTGTVSSVCIPRSPGRVDGPATSCKLVSPHGLLYRDGLLYVGEWQAIRAIPMTLPDTPSTTSTPTVTTEPSTPTPTTTKPYTPEPTTTEPYTPESTTTEPTVICPDDIKTAVEHGESTAAVSWVNPNGDVMKTKLPAGRHQYEFTLLDGSRCNFNVTVEGNSIDSFSTTSSPSGNTAPSSPQPASTAAIVRCPDDIITAVKEGERTAPVSWINPYGGEVDVELPPGESHYHMTLLDGTKCDFTVTVEGNSSLTGERNDSKPVTEISIGLDECPENVTYTVTDTSQRISISWLNISRVYVLKTELSVGEHLIQYQLNDTTTCFISLSITVKEKPGTCPKRAVFIQAIPEKQKTLASFQCTGPGVHHLELPIGSYRYDYVDRWGTSCPRELNVYDSRIMRRLDLVARYDIKCSEIQDASIRSLLLSLAQNLDRAINEICAGECEVTPNYDIMLQCDNDTTTISWPTDLMLPGDQQQLPDSVREKIVFELQRASMLTVFLPTRIPPIIYPMRTAHGLAAEIVLTDICPDGFSLDPQKSLCV